MLSILFFLQDNFLFSQETAPPSDIPPEWENFHENQNPTFFVDLNGKNIPKKVLKARAESMVAVQVWYKALSPNKRIFDEAGYGAGFAVWENYVLTNLHLFGRYPVLWRGSEQFPTIPWIFDGQHYFSSELVAYDFSLDLALLRINTPNMENQKFSKKPAKLFDLNTKEKDSFERLASFEHFYAFGSYITDPSIFSVLKLGPFQAITNNTDEGYISRVPMGILHGAVPNGFSGGALWTPQGEVAGVVTRGDETKTIVITTETISNFLAAAAAGLGSDSRGRPLNTIEQK